jgi:hypothetical protein
MLTDGFQRSVRRQIAAQRGRTPEERLQEVFDLLDVCNELAALNPQADQIRGRIDEINQLRRQELRDVTKRLLRANRPDAQGSA